MGGMQEKLEEATVKLDRLKAKHAKRDDELGELTAHASCLAEASPVQSLCRTVNGTCNNPCAGMQRRIWKHGKHVLSPARRSLTLRHGRRAGQRLDDVNGRLASISKGTDMKQDLIKRNQTRIAELAREARCVLAVVHHSISAWMPMLDFQYCRLHHGIDFHPSHPSLGFVDPDIYGQGLTGTAW